MKTLTAVFRELAGLFVDNGLLALAIIVVVVFAAIVAGTAPTAPIAAGVVLLAGCLGVLFGSAVLGGKR